MIKSILSLFAPTLGRRYDEECREGLKALWTAVKDDGCVMANPLTGQLEPEGWHVYVQYGECGEEFLGSTLLEAIDVARKKLNA